MARAWPASIAAGLALAIAGALPAAAEDYPNRPIRVIVPLTAGSVTDVVMRAIGTELSVRMIRGLFLRSDYDYD